MLALGPTVRAAKIVPHTAAGEAGIIPLFSE